MELAAIARNQRRRGVWAAYAGLPAEHGDRRARYATMSCATRERLSEARRESEAMAADSKLRMQGSARETAAIARPVLRCRWRNVGYHHAGFSVVGVDLLDQPDYPFVMVRGDALAYLRPGEPRRDPREPPVRRTRSRGISGRTAIATAGASSRRPGRAAAAGTRPAVDHRERAGRADGA